MKQAASHVGPWTTPSEPLRSADWLLNLGHSSGRRQLTKQVVLIALGAACWAGILWLFGAL
jgi:hypothetical protein